jgi:hypothetical protein
VRGVFSHPSRVTERNSAICLRVHPVEAGAGVGAKDAQGKLSAGGVRGNGASARMR